MEQEHYTSSLRDFLTVLFKHKRKILTVFPAIVITVTVISFLLPPIYEAKSSIMIRFGRENIYRPEVGEKNPVIPYQSFSQSEAINSEIEVFTSNDLIEKVLLAQGLEKIYPKLAKKPQGKMTSLQAAVLKFEKDITVESIKGANVIKASFQHHDPEIAVAALRNLVEFFKEKHLEVLSQPKSSFLVNQLLTYRRKLEESENALESFRQKYRVYSLDEQRSLLLKQRDHLDNSLKDTENRIQEQRQKLTFLTNQKKQISDNILLSSENVRHTIIDDAQAQLLTLQIKEQELRTKYREDNPLVVNTRMEIGIVKDFLKNQETVPKDKVTTGQNRVFQEITMEIIKTKAELNTLEAKYAALPLQISQQDKDLQSVDFREKEFRKLQRELNTSERNYKTYFDKVEEERISEDMDLQKLSNISVIQSATVSAKPVKPRKGLNIAVGIILGAASGIGLALFSEYYLTESISTPERAGKLLDLPVLATVPYKES